MDLPWPIWAALWLVAINLFTWLSFAADKRVAKAGGRRTPEKILLLMALVGGTPAAIAAQRILRHKTRKEPFRTLLVAIAFGQVVVLVAAVAWLS